MIYVWDEMSGEVKPIDLAEADEDGNFPWGSPERVAGLQLRGYGVAEETDRVAEARLHDEIPKSWTTDHVIDLPDGTRIVIESDDRGHTAVWVTTKED